MNHRWVARGLVVALHVGLIAGLWLHQAAPQRDHRDRRMTTVWLIAPQARQNPPPARPPLPAPRRTAPERPDIAQDVTHPALTTQAPPVAAQPSPAATQPEITPAEPPRTTLRLTLPPGYAASSAVARNPALGDPRSNSVRPTFEDRIADATGGAGAWVEERTSDNRAQAVGALGEHRTVMRRGDTCVEIFRSRISDTDPFNGNVAPRAGKMLGKPYKCK